MSFAASRPSLLALALVVSTVGSQAFAELTFSVNFSDQANTQLTASERALFTDGIAFWDDIIVGHRDGVSRNFSLDVDTFSSPRNDDGLILLGSAGPRGVITSGVVEGATRGDGRFAIAQGGFAQFNVNDDAGPLSFNTIVHEIGHTLGIGTLWQANNVYEAGSGEYTGAAGLAGFQAEFLGQQDATFVPVELDGGPGTANAHWNEGIFGSTAFGATGILTADGQDLGSEILTGRLGFNEPIFLSQLTVGSLVDIGFVVVPEPTTATVALFGLALLARRGARRRAA